VKVSPKLALAHASLGNALLGTGKYADAKQSFERATELDPALPEGHRGLAQVLEKTHHVKEAEAAYRRAISLRPSDWTSQMSLAVFFYNQARYAEMEGPLTKVIATAPENPVGYSTLGAAKVKLGDLDGAAALFQRALTYQPTPANATNLGSVEFYRGRYPEAEVQFRRSIELGAVQYIMFGNLGDALRRMPGREREMLLAYREAIRRARERLVVNAKQPAVRSSLAVYLAKSGDLVQARREIGRALSEAPDMAEVQFKAATVFEIGRDRKRSASALQRAVRLGYSRFEIEHDPEMMELRKDIKWPVKPGTY